MPGIEPGAYRMRSERDTPTPHPRDNGLSPLPSFQLLTPWDIFRVTHTGH